MLVRWVVCYLFILCFLGCWDVTLCWLLSVGLCWCLWLCCLFCVWVVVCEFVLVDSVVYFLLFVLFDWWFSVVSYSVGFLLRSMVVCFVRLFCLIVNCVLLVDVSYVYSVLFCFAMSFVCCCFGCLGCWWWIALGFMVMVVWFVVCLVWDFVCFVICWVLVG